jgi:hypothetical protein
MELCAMRHSAEFIGIAQSEKILSAFTEAVKVTVYKTLILTAMEFKEPHFGKWK